MRSRGRLQAGHAACEQIADGSVVGVGGVDGYTEVGRDLRESVVPMQVQQSDQRASCCGGRGHGKSPPQMTMTS
jgi:hypothetical protein